MTTTLRRAMDTLQEIDGLTERLNQLRDGEAPSYNDIMSLINLLHQVREAILMSKLVTMVDNFVY